MAYISPSRFLAEGESVEVLFVDGGKRDPRWYSWYRGTVKEVLDHGEDDQGRYVDCEVEYEDGDVLNTRLHDNDFNSKTSLDAWRFPTSLNSVVQALTTIGASSASQGTDAESPMEEATYSPIRRIAYTAGLVLFATTVAKHLYSRYVQHCMEEPTCVPFDFDVICDAINRTCVSIVERVRAA